MTRHADAERFQGFRLMVVTTPHPASGRPLVDVVAECVAAGADAIQLRDKGATAEDLWRQARELLPVAREAGAVLIVNDRVEVAVASGAHGAHLGPTDLPVPAARRIAPPGFLLGYSTDSPAAARQAALEGADYLGVGAVYGTTSKAGLEGERIGPARVAEVGRAAGIPCLGIGGISAENAAAVFRACGGVAVLGAVMQSPNPGGAVRQILATMEASPSAPSAPIGGNQE